MASCLCLICSVKYSFFGVIPDIGAENAAAKKQKKTAIYYPKICFYKKEFVPLCRYNRERAITKEKMKTPFQQWNRLEYDLSITRLLLALFEMLISGYALSLFFRSHSYLLPFVLPEWVYYTISAIISVWMQCRIPYYFRLMVKEGNPMKNRWALIPIVALLVITTLTAYLNISAVNHYYSEVVNEKISKKANAPVSNKKEILEKQILNIKEEIATIKTEHGGIEKLNWGNTPLRQAAISRIMQLNQDLKLLESQLIGITEIDTSKESKRQEKKSIYLSLLTILFSLILLIVNSCLSQRGHNVNMSPPVELATVSNNHLVTDIKANPPDTSTDICNNCHLVAGDSIKNKEEFSHENADSEPPHTIAVVSTVSRQQNSPKKRGRPRKQPQYSLSLF